MKKFNKVTTVNLNVDAEVLPLSVSFVARAVNAKNTVIHLRNLRESMTKNMCNDIAILVEFFDDLYEAMTDDSSTAPVLKD